MGESLSNDSQLAPPSDAAFKNKLATVIPQLRAFARSLCGNHRDYGRPRSDRAEREVRRQVGELVCYRWRDGSMTSC